MAGFKGLNLKQDEIEMEEDKAFIKPQKYNKYNYIFSPGKRVVFSPKRTWNP